MRSATILDSPIEYLKGVGPARGELLKKELSIFSFRDLLYLFPFRYVDRTKFHHIRDLHPDSGEVQVKGILRRLDLVGAGRKKRLSGVIRDDTGSMNLVWFQGIKWLKDSLVIGREYVVYGRVGAFGQSISIAHPEMEPYVPGKAESATSFFPVYPSTEKLNAKGLDSKGRRKLVRTLLDQLQERDVPENLPAYLTGQLGLVSRREAIEAIHFPRNEAESGRAVSRLKFEELFFLQLRLLRIRRRRKDEVRGFVFDRVGEQFHRFYKEKLPFELTNAQKRVIREIRRDLGSGVQMNRLLQGDVGSGKTIVALLSMLIAIDNGYQACMMAPTEILAQQHFQSLSEYLEGMDLRVAFLSGSVKGKARKEVLENLAEGAVHILVGTHALIEKPVVFHKLGFAITDEQHRFGVEQRAKLWKKSAPHPPHVLVMSATPIPRTLAMTLYGDLDVSVIDELPPGRKDIVTLHRTENHRLRVQGMMREEIGKGRQVYVVYPLIEESEALDLANLMDGYEAVMRAFPQPEYQISIVHGKMKPADKDFEMQRFVKGETQIMVATTVIEVGVNVPNATMMVIENTERFGLSQLHQLRGRVGRGGDQSYCVLMSGFKLTQEAKERIQTMVRTNNGFDIAEADLRLRGPGNIEGKQQSGVLNLRIADLGRDGRILQTAREIANRILDKDPGLERPENLPLRHHLQSEGKQFRAWSRIS